MATQSSAKARRTAARLAAVQALYQLELGADPTPRQAVYDLMQMRQGEDDEPLVQPDAEMLGAISAGVPDRLKDVDGLLDGALEGGRPLNHVEAIMRAILRAGVYELLTDATTASAIIINDYVNVAHAFFEGPEPAKVNAVLDKVSRQLGRAA
jgi:N utilization substance protein B